MKHKKFNNPGVGRYLTFHLPTSRGKLIIIYKNTSAGITQCYLKLWGVLNRTPMSQTRCHFYNIFTSICYPGVRSESRGYVTRYLLWEVNERCVRIPTLYFLPREHVLHILEYAINHHYLDLAYLDPPLCWHIFKSLTWKLNILNLKISNLA